MDGLPPTESERARQRAAMFRRRRIVFGVVALAVVVLLVLAGIALGGLISRLVQDITGESDPGPAAVSATPTPSASPGPSEEPSSGPSPSGSASDDAGGSGSAEPTESPSGKPSDDAGDKPSDEPSPSPSSTAPEALEPPCRGSAIQVTAGTDKTVYDRGERPELALKVMNLSQEPCTLNVGTTEQVFEVTTAEGDDVFSTEICQADPQDQDMVLVPHDEQTALFEWNRRNSEKDCTERGELVDPGSYRLTVTLGDHSSQPVAFRLTDDKPEGQG
ncbi:hypothetical protein M3C74_08065 [Micrococcus lylae]|uniref:hypothetical protein n=1 Tax=Micrococcus lylae TaxID=1273 RepID=UPI0021A2F53A|nr:hypothetical protein [Micrococcus lylae]MCT2007914.1 hypothetical protein [Micrococcus lylae]MCT2071782.1 hypothetical protein [Micrococcus lylae]